MSLLLALTGGSAGAYTLDAEAGGFTLTGVAAAIVQGYALNAEDGSFTLTGQAATFTQSHVLDCEAGSFTVTGNDAEFVYSGGEAEPTFSGEVVLQRKRVYIKRGKQYLIFNTLAEADSYVAAEEAIETARQSSRGAARRKVKALNVPKPEVVPAVEPEKLEVMLERFNLPFNLSAAISKEDFAALHYIQEQLAIMQDDEDIELLLLTL